MIKKKSSFSGEAYASIKISKKVHIRGSIIEVEDRILILKEKIQINISRKVKGNSLSDVVSVSGLNLRESLSVRFKSYLKNLLINLNLYERKSIHSPNPTIFIESKIAL